MGLIRRVDRVRGELLDFGLDLQTGRLMLNASARRVVPGYLARPSASGSAKSEEQGDYDRFVEAFFLHRPGRVSLDTLKQIVWATVLSTGETRCQMPLWATWDITRKCPFSCVYCSAHLATDVVELAPTAKLAIADQLVQAGVVQVALQGGEPFLAEGVGEVVKRLIEGGVGLNVATSGMGLSPRVLEAIKCAQPGQVRLQVSLDSVDEVTNDRIRGPGAHSTSLRALKLIRQHGVRVGIHSVVTRDTVDGLEDLYRLANTLGCAAIALSRVLPAGRGVALANVDEERFVRAALRLVEIRQAIGGCPIGVVSIGNFSHIPDFRAALRRHKLDCPEFDTLPLHCDGGRARIEIDADGSVYPCFLLRYAEFRGGSLATETLDRAWARLGTIPLPPLHRAEKEQCAICAAKWCNTGCAAVALNQTGRMVARDPSCRGPVFNETS